MCFSSSSPSCPASAVVVFDIVAAGWLRACLTSCHRRAYRPCVGPTLPTQFCSQYSRGVECKYAVQNTPGPVHFPPCKLLHHHLLSFAFLPPRPPPCGSCDAEPHTISARQCVQEGSYWRCSPWLPRQRQRLSSRLHLCHAWMPRHPVSRSRAANAARSHLSEAARESRPIFRPTSY